MASTGSYGVRLKSLNRYNIKDKTYEFGKVYMVSIEERAQLLGDSNGDYFEDVLVTAEECIFVQDNKHTLAIRNGAGRLAAPPPVAIPAVQNGPPGFSDAGVDVGDVTQELGDAKGGKRKLRLKTTAKTKAPPREIVAGEASPAAAAGDKGANATPGPEIAVPADLADEAGVEV